MADKKSQKLIEQNKKAQDKSGKLKAHYRDMPRYKVIFAYEGQFKNDFKKTVSRMVTDLNKRATKMIIK